MQFFESGKLPVTPAMYFIYGDGGTGKTTLFKQFDGKKLLISFDMSTNPLQGDESIDVALIDEQDKPQIQQVTTYFLIKAIQSGRYQAICLDNVTSLQNYVLENIDGDSRDGRQNYQKLQLWFRQLGSFLRQSGVTVYVTSHQIDKGADVIKGRYEADMNVKTFNALTSMFDLVGRIYLQDGVRMIDLDPEQGNHAKNRIDDRKLIKAEELLNKEGNK